MQEKTLKNTTINYIIAKNDFENTVIYKFVF